MADPASEKRLIRKRKIGKRKAPASAGPDFYYRLNFIERHSSSRFKNLRNLSPAGTDPTNTCKLVKKTIDEMTVK